MSIIRRYKDDTGKVVEHVMKPMRISELINILQDIQKEISNKDPRVVIDIGGDYHDPYILQPGDIYTESREAGNQVIVIDATGKWSDKEE